ncbi:alpha-tocopherol transfer protein-like [Zophobas morio]|uniref:alpha-tocopherol transfer protein-like n=1 Tax=Zophobas morio TaxID=2755281 RepID=UPI0030833FC4
MSNDKTPDLFDKPARQYNSSGRALAEDAIRLQKWLETQPHLPKMLDTQAVKNFLLLNKCSFEITKQKIDNYYSVRAKVPDIAFEINPKRPCHQEFNDMVYFVDYPQLTDEMYKITYFKAKGGFLPDNYEPINIPRKYFIMQELKLRYDVMHGDILVFDCKGHTLNIALKVTPVLAYKTIVLLYQQVFSIRIKAVHLINMPPILKTVLNLVKSLLSPKLAARIYVHGDENILKKLIPLNLLPVDFGGDGLSLEELEGILKARCAKNQELFERLGEIKVDENLRPEKLEDDDTLGVYGSFKKLEID